MSSAARCQTMFGPRYPPETVSLFICKNVGRESGPGKKVAHLFVMVAVRANDLP